MQKLVISAVALSASLLLSACNDTEESGESVPQTYSFSSNFIAGESSIKYNGQVCRLTLISALSSAIEDSQEIVKADYRGDAVPYYDDTLAGSLAEQSVQNILGTTDPILADRDTLGELCGTSYLDQKFAGNDTSTDHKDWTTGFQGVAGEIDAEAFLRSLISDASTQALNGTEATGANHYVSPNGLDYGQYVQKLLLGALAFQQGADDYLDNDVAGKGLFASAQQNGSNPYSSLEHVWDEGFGYFGAARDFADRTTEENRGGAVDSDGDGFVDPRSEYGAGASTNAAKRDAGSDPAAASNFQEEAFAAFLAGRAIITRTQVDFDQMSQADQDALVEARDTAVGTWEKALAATVVHYINDTLAEMELVDTETFDINELAKVWTEMKAFALAFQFNQRSPLLESDPDNTGQTLFQTLHELLNDQPSQTASMEGGDPVMTNDSSYRTDLLAARALLGSAYDFAEANLEVW